MNEGRKIMFGLMSIVFIVTALNFFYVDVGNGMGLVSPSSANMSTFNQTMQVMNFTETAKGDVTGLEKVPVIGDIAALVGNSMKAMQILFSVPTLFLNMLGEATSLFGVPVALSNIFNAFIWILIIFIVISAGLRYRV